MKYLSKIPLLLTAGLGLWAWYGGFEIIGMCWLIIAQLMLIEQAIKEKK